MAREMKKRVSQFGLENSKAIDESERILEAGRQQRKEIRERKESGEDVESVTIPSAEVPTVTAPVVPVKKTTNGIVVDVPIDDYMALMQMKVMTRRTLKDLALQAIHEFVERNK